jgi:hypothetical protein
MQLNIIFTEENFELIKIKIDNYFSQSMRILKVDHSIFEQYEIRPTERIFIPKIWSYRILKNNGLYHFGTI